MTKYSNEILERRRAATFRWSAALEHLEVGQDFAIPEWTVEEADVATFAELTGDRHPQHVDPAWAISSPFGERTAHGLLTLSRAVGAIPFDPKRVIALRRVTEATFERPALIGATLRAEGRVVAINPAIEDAGLVTLAITVVEAGGGAVCRASIEVLWRRESTAVPAAG